VVRAPASSQLTITAISGMPARIHTSSATGTLPRLAVSLRTRPMLIARMPSASTMPKMVATSVICATTVICASTVSMLAPAVGAVCLALVIWVAVSPPSPWISQPAVVAVNLNSRMACSVITVFGAEVPAGRAPISWIGGLARQLPGRQGLRGGSWGCPTAACAASWTGRAARLPAIVSSALLPDLLGPITATIAPGSTDRLTPVSACTPVASWP
jgi:hypothetical protein